MDVVYKDKSFIIDRILEIARRFVVLNKNFMQYGLDTIF